MGMSPMMSQLKAALNDAGIESGSTSDEVIDAAVQFIKAAIVIPVSITLPPPLTDEPKPKPKRAPKSKA